MECNESLTKPPAKPNAKLLMKPLTKPLVKPLGKLADAVGGFFRFRKNTK